MFYVYFWNDPRVDEVFYVGKGMNQRAWKKHHNQRCENRRQRIHSAGFSDRDIVQIVRDGLTEKAALDLEEKYITQYKIIEDGGTLFNYRKKGLAKGSWQKISNSEIKNIIKLYNNNKTMKEIGLLYNVHETTIRKYLLEAKNTIRKSGYTEPHPSNWSYIISLLMGGRSKVSIMKEFGFCYPTFQRLLLERPNG